ncbi:hypothetical protein NML43_04820 [Rhodopseudomonas palustris]|jgi:hypothetical protein|uniref:hypothetical protein n=1 Tax=Rhodopseudomonas TaxID=1073 RepID=UPI0006B8B0F1|nr:MULTISPECIES: hypothetical protein [Rhodopseudomonas]KPF95618.1 hypothetical protein IP86_18535 [Rhodopseudomonas sp. AAP120]MCP9626411.1 hypothetical protein [Rhodopseudomonas palustris]
MKKIALGVAAALALGFTAFAGPASAAPAAPANSSIVKPMTDVSAQRYVERRRVIRRGPHCTVRKVVTRGPHGHRVVRTSRVCR